ncbi:molecular chaperone DnaJ [Verrucomicrobia bacterium SCGC AG-212-E04]|nr:molecular chaperone DnaJ [Verrucomicrobia bacterium SCGC AG-212-E04]
MPADFKDYYTTLGVSKTATDAEIKSAFRKLARKYHPDVAKDKKTAEEKFKEINEANEVLSDPVKRKKYDELGANWQDGGGFQPPPGWQAGARRRADGTPAQEFHFEGTGFSDFFEQFFGGGGRRNYGFPSGDDDFSGGADASRPRRGSDIEGDILVTLDEAMHGTMRPISLQTVDPRTGKVETHSFTVRIPAGATDGRRIRVPGKGADGTGGGAAGDLYLRVRLAAHPDFRPRGADLYYDLDLSPWEAVLGEQVIVPGLTGAIKVRIPPGTANGQQLRVRAQGLPIGKTGERGDLYVVSNIQIPTELTDAERTLWEKLKVASSFEPRGAAKS